MKKSFKTWLYSRRFIKRLREGFAWATDSFILLVFGLLIYAAFVLTVAWHTDRAICYIAGVSHMLGIPGLIICIAGTLTLIHESEHVWKQNWVKMPIGLISVWFLYYGFLDFIWWIAGMLLRISPATSAYLTVFFVVASTLLVVAGYWNTKKVCTVTYRIPLDCQGGQYRIALISDIHLGSYVSAEHMEKVVDAVNALNPDLVVIAGDLVDDDLAILQDPEELAKAASALGKIRSREGTVLTLGNHDPNVSNDRWISFLEESRITLLHNRAMELSRINIVGMSDPSQNRRGSVKTVMAAVNTNKPTVVADHDPRYIDEAAEENAGLVLSGHTHAGQFFPATVATQLAVGKGKFYGCHKTGNTYTVVTSGAGFFNLPVRLGTKNEVVEIILGDLS